MKPPLPRSVMTEKDIVANIVSRMKHANWDPAFIYAFEKTGLLVGPGNLDALGEERVKEWTDAVAEFRSRIS